MPIQRSLLRAEGFLLEAAKARPYGSLELADGCTATPASALLCSPAHTCSEHSKSLHPRFARLTKSTCHCTDVALLGYIEDCRA